MEAAFLSRYDWNCWFLSHTWNMWSELKVNHLKIIQNGSGYKGRLVWKQVWSPNSLIIMRQASPSILAVFWWRTRLLYRTTLGADTPFLLPHPATCIHIKLKMQTFAEKNAGDETYQRSIIIIVFFKVNELVHIWYLWKSSFCLGYFLCLNNNFFILTKI